MGISVIDILPSCVSSVYFIWDPDWAWVSLGKWSALREVALVKDMANAGAKGMTYVYMGELRGMFYHSNGSSMSGYWIAGCGKMRYKSEYSPSYLLDPVSACFR
jgi:arginine-tRNA-protein transferase